MRKELKITDVELFIARRGVSTRCAIAAAIMTQIPSARRIKVDRETISWLDVSRNERWIFRTPPAARNFIEHWDAGEEVAPFTFAVSDASLVGVKVPRIRSAESRLTAPLRTNPTKRPGILMNRRADEDCETPTGP
jgi:hypothetical protein